MPRHQLNWLQRLLRWLGYGNKRRKSAVKQAGSSTSIPTAPDLKALNSVVEAVLNGAIALTSSPTPIKGRTWWANTPTPNSAESDFFRVWPRLARLGSACEVLSWTEVSAYPELSHTIATAMLKFQNEETLMLDHDPCPLPWGPLTYQACVAIHNSVWLVQSVPQGAKDWIVSGVRQKLNLWRQPASELAEATAGDLLLIHLFYEGLEHWHSETKKAQQEALKQYQPASTLLNVRQKLLRKAFWPKQRRAARKNVQLAAAELERIEEKLHRLSATASELNTIVSEWLNFSPITRLLENVREPSNKHLSLVPSLVNSGTEGLQRWLIRKLVRLTLPSPTPNLNNEVASLLLELRPKNLPLARNDEPWSALLFLLRFYALWASSCPELARLEQDLKGVINSHQKYYQAFFRPWRFLKRSIEKQQGVVMPSSRPYSVVLTEYQVLQGPLPRSEYWRDLRIETLWHKLENLEAYLAHNQVKRVVGPTVFETVEAET